MLVISSLVTPGSEAASSNRSWMHGRLEQHRVHHLVVQQDAHGADLVAEHVAAALALDADERHRLHDVGGQRDVGQRVFQVVHRATDLPIGRTLVPGPGGGTEDLESIGRTEPVPGRLTPSAGPRYAALDLDRVEGRGHDDTQHCSGERRGCLRARRGLCGDNRAGRRRGAGRAPPAASPTAPRSRTPSWAGSTRPPRRCTRR